VPARSGRVPLVLGCHVLGAGGQFADRVMASGSEPTYVPRAPHVSLQNVWLLHYGYARPEDVAAKYERYTARPGGHSDTHIQSIVAEPQLVPWDGPLIDVYLGARPAPGPALIGEHHEPTGA
jgi:hypothetical protein